MSAYEQISDLPMTIESVERRRYTEKTTSGFDRTTTEFRLAGDGVIGRGEDVTYETEDHAALVGTDPIDVEGEWTIDELSARLDEIDLFAHKPPEQAYFRNYRRWAGGRERRPRPRAPPAGNRSASASVASPSRSGSSSRRDWGATDDGPRRGTARARRRVGVQARSDARLAGRSVHNP